MNLFITPKVCKRITIKNLNVEKFLLWVIRTHCEPAAKLESAEHEMAIQGHRCKMKQSMFSPCFSSRRCKA